MSLRRELEALDRSRVEAAFDGAFDKCTSFEESGVMVDRLADDFPALAALVERLQARIAEEVDDHRAGIHVTLGAALVLLALVEHVQAEDMRLQFPDASV
jgi:hypothetical protein